MSPIICYDSSHSPLKSLYQWDINQTITVSGVAAAQPPMFHFCNRTSNTALVVRPTILDEMLEENSSVTWTSGSELTVPIPNILLQQAEPITVYLYQDDSGIDPEVTHGKTIFAIQIPVMPRQKPDDYEYVDNVNYVSIALLNARLARILRELTDGSSSDSSLEISDIREGYDGTTYESAGDAVRAIGTKAEGINSELRDIREGYDGTTYESAGDAVRAIGMEISDVRDELEQYVDAKAVNGLVYEGNMLYLTSNGEIVSDPVEIKGGGGGGGSGGGSVSSISITDVVKRTTVRDGEDAIFGFTATSTDDTSITVAWSVNGVVKQRVYDAESGTSFSFNAKDYLRPSDSNTVSAAISSEGGATVNRRWTVESTAFSISFSTTIQPIMLYQTNENVSVPVSVKAQARSTNIVTVSVNGHSISKSIIGNKDPVFELDKSWFSTGVNVVSAEMVSSEDNTDAATPISYRAIWCTGASNPIVVFENSQQNAIQYGSSELKFFVYDPDNELTGYTLTVSGGSYVLTADTVFDGEKTYYTLSDGQYSQATVTDGASIPTGMYYEYIPEVENLPNGQNIPRTARTVDYIPKTVGTKTVTLTCGSVSATMTLNVLSSGYDLNIFTGDELKYNLDPSGKSNDDANKESFGGFTFSQGFDWVNGGFQTDAGEAPAFVVKKGHRVTLSNRTLFGDSDAIGKTIDISFKVKNSDKYDAVAMTELNNGETKGLILKANEGELRLNNSSGLLFRYCEDNRIDLSINVEGAVDRRIMTIWMDGIPSQVNEYTEGMLVQDENALVIGSDDCDVWIYAIRIYNKSLSNREMLQNYIAMGASTDDKIARFQVNDVYDGNDAVDMNKLHAACPNLTIVHISANRMTTNKKDSVTPQSITIRDGGDLLTLNSGVVFKVQGTSSAAYGRAAYNLDIDFKSSGKTYTMSEGALPINYLNIKVNVASSENANNICAAAWYNNNQPYRVPARSTSGVRDTVEGKPCAVFFTNTNTEGIWIGSQFLKPGETVLYAMGDICNSKKNLAVFGQDGTGEHYAKGCIEVSGNDTAAQQFLASSVYNAEDGEWQTTSGSKVSTDFEWRAEPKDEDLQDVVTAWNNAVAWVVSTNQDAAEPDTNLSSSVTYNGTTYTKDTAAYRLAKFKNELGNYFAVNSLLFHFLYLEFFSALDNVSKNTFYSYEWDSTENKYLWNICKNYDDDTILGCDNDGFPLVNYGTDFGDKAGNRAIFNADANPLWVNIKDAFASELSAMYILLRSGGAWSADTIIRQWDNYQSVRPHATMIEDAYNKYIAPYKTTGVKVGSETKGYDPSYLPRLQGSKTYQRRQFLTYQSRYMDGKYGYYSTSDSISFRANADYGTTKDLSIKAYAKTYVTVIVDNGTKVSKKIDTGGTSVFNNTSMHSNATVYVTPESMVQSISPINEADLTTFAAAGASKLQYAMLGSSTTENESWDVNTGLSVPSSVLKNISIRNIVNFSKELDLSSNVELTSVDARGTKMSGIILPRYAPIEDVHLNSCNKIVAKNLNAVDTFDMEGGENLTDIIVENCNSVVNDAIATYLSDACSATGNKTRRIRAIGVDWSFDTADEMYAIATNWKGFNALGGEIDTPVIEGTCYIGTLSLTQKNVIESCFSNVTFTYGEVVLTYTVTFKNYDGTVLNTQVVNRGSGAANPTDQSNPLIATPTKPSTVEKTYTFTGWDKTFSSILSDTIVTAQFSEADRYYTVNYYAGSVLKQTKSVIAHGSTTYTGGVIEGNATLGIWSGWDATANNVVANMDIHATYLQPSTPSVNKKSMSYDYLFSDDSSDDSAYTLAEFYGIITQNNPKDYFNIGDRVKILTSTNEFTDTELVFELYGYNHYRITGDANNSFASCVWGIVDVMNAGHRMSAASSNNSNAGGWMNSGMRTWLNTNVFGALPAHWKSMIKTVNVLGVAGSGTTDINNSGNDGGDKLFLFSWAEVGLSTTNRQYMLNEVDAEAESVAFIRFNGNTARRRYRYTLTSDTVFDGTKTYYTLSDGQYSVATVVDGDSVPSNTYYEHPAVTWWLRSTSSGESNTFCFVFGDGNSSYSAGEGSIYGSSTNRYAVAFGFCI